MTNFLFSEQPIKAIIFDCDGTLVDSEESHFFAWRQAVQNWGGNLTPEEYLSYVGKSGTTIAHQLAEKIGRNCADELFAQKREYFLEYLHKGLLPIKDTVEFVYRLLEEKEKLGIKLAIASATVKPEIIKNLESLGLKDAFDVVLSGHEDLNDYHDPEGVNKPKPYIYLHAAKLLGVSPAECIVIEDSMTGVISGHSAGCITIAIPNRFTEMQDLSAATIKIDSLSGISIDEFLQIVRMSEKNRSLKWAKSFSSF
ncbi:MAG: HAD family phosphatase [Chlamydiota bacterium]